jgi:hypothetical protein
MKIHEWDWRIHRSAVFGSNDNRSARALIKPKAYLRQFGSIQARSTPRFSRAIMTVDVTYAKPNRNHDSGNLYPTMKAYVDGLANPDLFDRHNPDKGFLPDDNDKYLLGPLLRWSGEPAVDEFYNFHITLIGY